MKKSRFGEAQVIAILKEVEKGRTAKDVCREYSISESTYYQWKAKYGGMEASDIKRMRVHIPEQRERTFRAVRDHRFRTIVITDSAVNVTAFRDERNR